MKRIIPIIILIIALLMVGIFVFYSYNNFKIHEGFTSIPLSFDPYTSVSTYNWNGTAVSINDGFVKGKVRETDNQESLLLRAFSPTPKITVKGSNRPKTYLLRLENINPLNVTLKNENVTTKILDPHTILLTWDMAANAEKSIEITMKTPSPEFVILADNRNGYQTFSNIIAQINSFHPAFVIDNGDLVFSGEPNRYRLFYETVSKLQVPLYTTLGNHDIRKNGRGVYTQLFGPPYYSFDYQDTHFAFLDSSRGWTEKRAIPEEQYQWLERFEKCSRETHFCVYPHPVDGSPGGPPT